MAKRFFIVKNITSNCGGLSATNSRGQFNFVKKAILDPKPTGEKVIELDKYEAGICRLSILFNNYSAMSDLDFANHYLDFTENDKNECRKIRLAIRCWLDKNSTAWPESYFDTVWNSYDTLEKKLSNGAIINAYNHFETLPDTITDSITNDVINLAALNSMIDYLFQHIFDKYPR